MGGTGRVRAQQCVPPLPFYGGVGYRAAMAM